MKLAVFLVFILSAINSFAQTRVAFIEIRDSLGNLHQLEPGGRFSHIAISYKGRWLHAHPYRGVELVDSADLGKIGSLTILSLPDQNELTPEKLQQYLASPYDANFSWGGDGYYCSELVGKILGMPPEPMKFEAIVWKGSKPNSNVGLSPDDIFRKLTKSEKARRLRCENVFR